MLSMFSSNLSNTLMETATEIASFHEIVMTTVACKQESLTLQAPGVNSVYFPVSILGFTMAQMGIPMTLLLWTITLKNRVSTSSMFFSFVILGSCSLQLE